MVAPVLVVAAVVSLVLSPGSAATASPLTSQSETEPLPTSRSSPYQTEGNGGLELAATQSSRPLGQQAVRADDYFNLPVPALNTSTLTLGYLVEYRARGVTTSRDMKQVSGALAYALQVVNVEARVPGYNLTFVMRDTRMQTNDSLLSMSYLWRDDVIGFIASPSSCQNEAMLAGAWNLPILSYRCHSDKVLDRRDYPTLIRTFPPADSILSSVISLLQHFNWNKFSIIYGKIDNNSRQYQMLAHRLRMLATDHDLSVNHFLHYPEPLLPRDNDSIFHTIIQQSYVDTRIYLLIGSVNAVVKFTESLNSRGFVDSGQYQVIYVEALEHIANEPDKYFKMTYHNDNRSSLNVDWARCLLVVKSTSHEGFQDFYNNVRLYNGKPPFNFWSPENWEKRIPSHASYLYDAIIIYANALKQVINEGGSFRDGRAITSKILGLKYMSIQGYEAKINHKGIAEGSYTVLALTKLDSNESSSLTHAMLPVAGFQLSDDGQLPTFQLYNGSVIDWIRGEPPAAEPLCGYRGQNCLQPDSHIWEIIGGIISGLVVTAVVVSLLAYRNWRYEQEIEGLLWKIDRSLIHFSEMTADCCNKSSCLCYGHSGGAPRCESHVTSLESRNSLGRLFSFTGKYKGQIVALKTYTMGTTTLSRREKMEMKTMRELLHKNVNTFIGACLEASVLTLVTVYCHKGSLQDVLENEDMKLENVFIASLIKDLIEGMLYIHNSELICHGNLKSSNCLVTSRWTLQVAEFGLMDIRSAGRKLEDQYNNLLWKSPEILRSHGHLKASQSADVYAFSMILYEIFGRSGPYGAVAMDPQEVVRRVAAYCVDDAELFRPALTHLHCDDYIKDLMTTCWSENPSDRPNFQVIWRWLKPMRAGMDRNIFDHMLAMMEKYQEQLEDLVEQRTQQLREEKKKTEELLYRMLPQSVAEQLRRGEAVAPEVFDSVTVYFSDICGFTTLSAESTPMQIVNMLNDLYTCFDSIIQHFDVYKVETIGDAYMVASGLPIRNGSAHVTEIASMALTLVEVIKSFKIRHRPHEVLKLRIGIHSGPCVAGVVGLTMPRYTLFGDTINTASRIETHGQALKIHCSSHTKRLLDAVGGFRLEERGYINMKGKGSQLTYWLLGSDDVRCIQLQLQQAPDISLSAPQHQPSVLTNGSRLLHQRCGLLLHTHSHSLVVSSQCLLDVSNHPEFKDKSCSVPNVACATHNLSLKSLMTSYKQSLNSVLTQSPVTSHKQSVNSVLTQSPVTSHKQSVNSVLTQSPMTSHKQSVNSMRTQSPLISHKQSTNSLVSPPTVNSVRTQSPLTPHKQSTNSLVSPPTVNSVLTHSPLTPHKQSTNSLGSPPTVNSVRTQSPLTSHKQSTNSLVSPPTVNSHKCSLNDLTLLRKKELLQNSCLQRFIDLNGDGHETSTELSLLLDCLPLASVSDTEL